MKVQNQAILSIGSNQGNRLENVQKCIQLIQLEIGTVFSVSKLYETPAWGFDGDSFYNCVVAIHTHKSAQKLLSGILKIEKVLGRTRSLQEGYQPRIIDIDIIGFENEVIDTPALVVPHPQMQKRLFVLLPMNDLKLDYLHRFVQNPLAFFLLECY
jgi:2-amino-4-hydroxy-6-hydroxymethyldihydropteridine diphosphokinase